MGGEQEQQKTYHDRKHYGSECSVNDEVLLIKSTLCKMKKKKFKTIYNGPHLIKQVVNDQNFWLMTKKSIKDQKLIMVGMNQRKQMLKKWEVKNGAKNSTKKRKSETRKKTFCIR